MEEVLSYEGNSSNERSSSIRMFYLFLISLVILFYKLSLVVFFVIIFYACIKICFYLIYNIFFIN